MAAFLLWESFHFQGPASWETRVCEEINGTQPSPTLLALLFLPWCLQMSAVKQVASLRSLIMSFPFGNVLTLICSKAEQSSQKLCFYRDLITCWWSAAPGCNLVCGFISGNKKKVICFCQCEVLFANPLRSEDFNLKSYTAVYIMWLA